MNMVQPMTFEQVETWVFDLDNTLYPASCRLFDQIDVRMTAFIGTLLDVDPVEARRVQKHFFVEYGTTLRGLMLEHGVEPTEFLHYVHDIDHSPVPENSALGAAMARLPGRKLVFTNATTAHARAVLARLGIAGHIEDIFDIAAAGYVPKPQPDAYRRFVEDQRIDPARAAMFEDIVRNLKTPHALGMTTVLVQTPGNEDGGLVNRLYGETADAGYVHHVTGDLTGFLEQLGP